jgi:hypothetical protein
MRVNNVNVVVTNNFFQAGCTENVCRITKRHIMPDNRAITEHRTQITARSHGQMNLVTALRQCLCEIGDVAFASAATFGGTNLQNPHLLCA